MAAAHGLEVEAKSVIAEYGSASDMTGRPGLMTLLNKVENSKVETLVITRLDQLWRDFASANRLADVLVARGVTVMTKDHVFHPD